MSSSRVYRTSGGSIVRTSGEYHGRVVVEFDWVEEHSACVDCEPVPDCIDGYLYWECEYCGGGQAELVLTSEGVSEGQQG